MMRAWTQPLIWVSFFFAIFAGNTSAQELVDAPETITVIQRIHTDYRRLGVIGKALEHSLNAQTVVRPNEGVSHVISRLYAVGSSNAAPAYAQISALIRSANGLSENESLAAGEHLVVPDIPPIALATPSPSNPFNGIPKLSIDIRTAEQVTNAPLYLEEDRKLQQTLREGASSVMSIRQLTVRQAQDAADKDPDLIVERAKLQIHFSSSGTSNASAVLSHEDSVLIHKVALAQPKQRPLMIVFDDTWPDLNEEEASRRYVLSAVRDLRKLFNFPAMTSFDEGCNLNAKVSNWSAMQDTPHSAKIKQSLAPLLEAAGSSSPVTLVFVPMLAGQPCTKEVLGQLIELHLLMLHMGSDVGRGVPKDLLTAYHKTAQTNIDALRTQIYGGDGESDVEVIQAVLDFAARQGAALASPVFTSMSWEFQPEHWHILVPSEYGGLFVVAAGNDQPTDPVVKSKIQFAERSAHPGDMLAVMNVDDSGQLTCKSNMVDPAGNAFATSYRGDTATDCGTSFSAPRVAWLLALREASRPKIADLTDLSVQIRRELKAAGYSDISASEPKKKLDLGTLFKGLVQ